MSPIVVPNDGPMSGKIKGGSFSGEDTLRLTQPSLAVRRRLFVRGVDPAIGDRRVEYNSLKGTFPTPPIRPANQVGQRTDR